MREDNNGRARSEIFHIVFEPLELLITELSQTPGLKIKHVDQSNEMDAVFVKAIPTGALGFDALQIPFAVKLAAVI